MPIFDVAPSYAMHSTEVTMFLSTALWDSIHNIFSTFSTHWQEETAQFGLDTKRRMNSATDEPSTDWKRGLACRKNGQWVQIDPSTIKPLNGYRLDLKRRHDKMTRWCFFLCKPKLALRCWSPPPVLALINDTLTSVIDSSGQYYFRNVSVTHLASTGIYIP